MLKRFYPTKTRKCYVPNVTWSLHHNIIADVGFEEVPFRYYDSQSKLLDFKGMMEDLEKIEDEAILLLQTSC